MISASNRRRSFSPKCDITLTPGAIGWRLAKCDISCGRPALCLLGRENFNIAYQGVLEPLTLGAFLVLATFIFTYLGRLISLWTAREAAEGVLFLVVADLFRGQPFRVAFADRDDVIQQVVAMTSRWLRRKVGAIP